MTTKLKLHGELAKFIGNDEFYIQANTVAKSISFLVNNFPKVEGYMNDKYYKVLVNNSEVDAEELHYPTGSQEIQIVPVITGAGDFAKIFLGAALIGLSFGALGAFGTASLAGGFAGASGLAKVTFFVGLNLVLDGVTGLLFPIPEIDPSGGESDPRVSFSFSGLQNTSRAGTPVPICYGEILTGSVVISGSITTDEVEA
jgi:predicted phage tail protein